jgi:hypothetical protein
MTSLPDAAEVTAVPPDVIVSVVVVGAGVAQACSAPAEKSVTKAAEKNKRQESLSVMN